MNRKEVLANANKCVNGDREQDYGSPENNFRTIAAMWNAYLGNKTGAARGVAPVALDAKDVAAMLCLLKVARISSGHAKADNWIDLAGYAACGGELETDNAAPQKACAPTQVQQTHNVVPAYRRQSTGGAERV